MQYRQLGDSGPKVSVLAFGAWQIGDPAYWGADAEADAQAAVDAALDVGITLFDTAEGYGGGESERALGAALGARRSRVHIATKVSASNCRPDALRRSCETSLRRLRADVIDLYQVHWPFREVPFADVCGEMARLQAEGKVRAVGVSNFGRQDLTDWLAVGPCASNQLGYNLLFRAVEYDILPVCVTHGVGVLVYMPLLQGILSGRWKTVEDIPPLRRRTRHFAGTREGVRHGEAGCEDLTMKTLRQVSSIADELGQSPANVAAAWLLVQPGVASVIVGARNAAQLERNVAAASLRLDEPTLKRLDEATRPLKERLGSNADMWECDARSRIR